MPTTIPLKEVQANLKQLIDQLAQGEEIVITEAQQPVATRRDSRLRGPADDRAKENLLSNHGRTTTMEM